MQFRQVSTTAVISNMLSMAVVMNRGVVVRNGLLSAMVFAAPTVLYLDLIRRMRNAVVAFKLVRAARRLRPIVDVRLGGNLQTVGWTRKRADTSGRGSS